MNTVAFDMKSKRWTRQITWAMTTFLGCVPLPLGVMLRSLGYKIIFRRIGKSVRIQTGVDFTDADCIEVGNQVVISQGSHVDVRGENRVILGNQVFLDRDVRISCGNGKGLAKLQENVRLDRGVDIKVHSHGRTVIGKRTYVGPYTCLSGYGDIVIGEDCLIASHTSLYAHNYNFKDANKPIREQGYQYKGIVIGDNCWLGSGVRVLDGVTIGAGSVIGAGTVVTKDIPPNSVAVGTPAKVIGPRTK